MWNLPKAVGNISTGHALGWIVWIGSLPSNSVNEISQRLKFPAPLASCIRETARILPLLRGLIGQKPSEICALVDSVPAVSLYAAYVLIQDETIQQLISDYLQKWKKIQPVTTGDDLRNAGVLPGPQYKRILDNLRAAYLDGTISSVEEEKQLLSYLIQQD
jgi:tRNA nucleotidyltransferase (CCA-adding enzyme)